MVGKYSSKYYKLRITKKIKMVMIITKINVYKMGIMNRSLTMTILSSKISTLDKMITIMPIKEIKITIKTIIKTLNSMIMNTTISQKIMKETS